MERFKEVIVTTTISPSMIWKDPVIIKEIDEKEFKELIEKRDFKSAVGHEVTAKILSKKFNIDIKFNRENIAITYNTLILAAIPQFRVSESREFTEDEIKSAEFRYFIAYTIDIDEINRIAEASSDPYNLYG